MNRKIIAALLLAAMAFSLAACGTSAPAQTTQAPAIEAPTAGPVQTEASEVTQAPAEAGAPAAETAEPSTISAENKALIEDSLQAIYDVQPGSAGSSLRTMIAAGKLLDLAETLTDQVDASELCQAAYDWAQNNEKIEGAFDEAYVSVRETAFDYLANPETYDGQLEDCGYVFTHENHTQAYLEYITNYIEISRATGE